MLLLPSYFKSIEEFVFLMKDCDFFLLFLPRLSLLSKTCLKDEILINTYLQIQCQMLFLVMITVIKNFIPSPVHSEFWI